MANVTKNKNNDDEQILNPEQLPGLIETLLTPLDNDTIDDEKLEETIFRNVLFVTKIFKNAIANNILKYEDIKQQEAMAPSAKEAEKNE